MIYRFIKTWSRDYICYVEADSYEEAKRKSEDEEDCEWEEDDEFYCSLYNGAQIVLEDGMSLDDVDSDYIERCDWKDIDDDEFFSNFKS